MRVLIWCPPGWGCGTLYLVDDPDLVGGVPRWRCPCSDAPVSHVLSEADWLAWSEPVSLLRPFAGRERKFTLLHEAALQARLGQMLDPSESAARPDPRKHLCDLIRDVFGYPCRQLGFGEAWLTRHADTAVKIARCIYDEDRFADLPVLADALEEAGCTNPHILGHCRGPGPHVRGCWVVDLLLGQD